MKYNSIDIFCHCIDNFGDAGVTYRFAKELKLARPEVRVRVFIDDLQTLSSIINGSNIICNDGCRIDTTRDVQTVESITYINTSSINNNNANAFAITHGVADVMVEMFACYIPPTLLELAYSNSKLIINLEYLSAEEWVDDYHLKESLLGRGAVRKFYFMPGLREGTGGLIFNSQLNSMLSQNTFNERAVLRDILERYGVDITHNNRTNNNSNDNNDGTDNDHLIGTIFTYERRFDTLIEDLNKSNRKTTLLVFGEKAQRGMAATLERVYINNNINIINMPFLTQHDYDTLLCCTDFNIVRGEDSLARALLSGKPFIWQAYIQDDKYQLVKVEALLKAMLPYFGDNDELYTAYHDLMMAFNDVTRESTDQTTRERYDVFFKNLPIFSHFARAINYFMLRHCDLIKKFCDFLDNYTI